MKLEAVFPRMAGCPGLPSSPSGIPADDAGVFALFAAGDTAGIDRFDHEDAIGHLRRLSPDCLAHLVAFQALNRMSTIATGLMDRYIERRHGREDAVCEIPSLSACFADSYGLPLFREQFERSAREVAGMAPADAAQLAAAFCRHDETLMATFSDRFAAGAEKRGVDARLSAAMIDFFRRTAPFALPERRLAEFAVEGYRLAWLKRRCRDAFEAMRLEAEGAGLPVPA